MKIVKILAIIAGALLFIGILATNSFAKENKTCFIGDSFTEGLEMYSGIENADFYGYRGISTTGVLNRDLIIKDLNGKSYDNIHVLLGVNEVCNNDSDTFIENYVKIINQIVELQPDAKITVQAIFHTTKNKSNNSSFKNEYIDEYNFRLWYLSTMYIPKINYVDWNSLYDNGNGNAMFSDYSKDGVHLKSSCYSSWAAELKKCYGL